MATKGFTEEEEFEFALAHEKEMASSSGTVSGQPPISSAHATRRVSSPFDMARSASSFLRNQFPSSPDTKRSSGDMMKRIGSLFSPIPDYETLANPLGEKLRQLEESGNLVKSTAEKSVGNLVERGMNPMIGGTLATGMALAPFTPSEFAQYGMDIPAEGAVVPAAKSVDSFLGNVPSRVLNTPLENMFGIPTLRARASQGLKNVSDMGARMFGVGAEPPPPEIKGEFLSNLQGLKEQTKGIEGKMESDQMEAAKSAISKRNEAIAAQEEEQAGVQKEIGSQREQAKTKFLEGVKSSEQKRFEEETGKFSSKFGEKPIELSESGKKVRSDFQEVLNEKRKVGEEAYEKLSELSGGKKVTHDLNSKRYILDTFDRYGLNLPSEFGEGVEASDLVNQLKEKYGITGQQAMQAIQSSEEGTLLRDRFTGENVSRETVNKFKRMRDYLSKLKNPDLTIGDLSDIRTDVGRYAYEGADNQIKSAYRGLYHSLTEDINTSAESHGFLKESLDARSKWRDFRQTEQSDLASIITDKDPEKILDAVVGSNSPSKVKELFGHFKPESHDNIRNGVLSKIKENATTVSEKGSVLDPKAVRSQLESKTNETWKALFGDQYPLFENYRKIVNTVASEENVKLMAAKGLGESVTEQNVSGFLSHQKESTANINLPKVQNKVLNLMKNIASMADGDLKDTAMDDTIGMIHLFPTQIYRSFKRMVNKGTFPSRMVKMINESGVSEAEKGLFRSAALPESKAASTLFSIPNMAVRATRPMRSAAPFLGVKRFLTGNDENQ